MTAEPAYDQPPPSVSRSDRVLARYYCTAFAWPTIADPAGVWLRLGDAVDALAIGAGLALEVNRILIPSLLGAPIIEVRGPSTIWIFLTQPRTPLRQSTWAELSRLGIGWREPGSALRLPPLRGIASGFRWLSCPIRGVGLPPWTAVVGAARSASIRVTNRPLRASGVHGNQGCAPQPLS
jgi:hypothetical protein